MDGRTHSFGIYHERKVHTHVLCSTLYPQSTLDECESGGWLWRWSERGRNAGRAMTRDGRFHAQACLSVTETTTLEEFDKPPKEPRAARGVYVRFGSKIRSVNPCEL